jgi:CBS domain-containing protein
MTPNPVTVPAALPLRQFVENCALFYDFSAFPVTDEGGRLVGLLRSSAASRVERGLWQDVTVGDVMEPATEEMTISPAASAVLALARLGAEKGKRLVVEQGGRPVGIVSLRDLIGLIALGPHAAPGR